MGAGVTSVDANHDGQEAAVREANETFDRLRQGVEEALKGDDPLDVLALAQGAGLHFDEAALKRLRIPPKIHPHPFLPWFMWFPWRPLWSHYWEETHPDSEAAQAFTPQVSDQLAAFLTDSRVAGIVPCP